MDKQGKLKLLISIVDRGKGQDVVARLKKSGSLLHTILLGRGTAKSELLDYLGLGVTEKDVAFSYLYGPKIENILDRLARSMQMKMPGGGIAFTVNITSIGGAQTLAYLKGDMEDNAMAQQEGKNMENQAFSLIITIVNRGFTDQVMDAASKAGARGGTVMHGRSAGQEEAAQFFGITIQPEKEVVMILVPKEKRQAVMQAIGKGAGPSTEGHGFSFSLPVDQVTGMAGMDQDEDDQD